MADPLGDGEHDHAGDAPSLEDVFACRLCKRDIGRYFKLGSLFCPFCGAAINPEAVPGRFSRDSNMISGRAFWSIKWSILAVLIGMGLLLAATLIITIILVIPFVINDPEAFLSDPDALEELITGLLGNPYATVVLSLAEFTLLLVPVLLVKKYQKPIGKRLQLLGWRPYYTPGGDAATSRTRLLRDLLVSMAIATAMVGFQFLLVLGNDAFWSLFVPIDPLQDTFSNIDQSLLAADPFQLMALVGSMLFIIGPAEEFLFRGYTQQGLESRLGEQKALIITALLFTVVHIIGGLI
nr:CPBP family intramembrane metalloprotease [Candidatus Sigynarchaeota archaeon]